MGSSFYVEDGNSTVYLVEQVDGFHAVLCPIFIWQHEPDLFDDEPECSCEPVYRLTLHKPEGGVSSVAEAPPGEIERPAAHDVIRRLLDGWEPDVPCLGPEVWCWFRGDDDPEPLTPAELLVLSAVKERS